MDKKQLDQIAGMFEQAPERIAEFAKETYVASFQKYMQDNAPVWRIVAGVWEQDSPRKKQSMEEIVECLFRAAKEKIDAVKGRTKRENLRLNLNLYMVSYFLPAIIAYQNQCGGPKEDREKLTKAICDKWSEGFGQQIQAADYESIQNGFKNKLCFVTTAVCQGLKKPQNCREIVLMKHYRDDYLANLEDGDALIREYYDIAPTIVKRIAKEAFPEEKYRYLWNAYISKCVSFVENGEKERCRDLYETMMSELKEEYMTTDRHPYKS